MMKQITKIWELMGAASRRGLFLVGILLGVSTVLEMAGIGLLIPLFHVLLTPDSIDTLPIVGPILGPAMRSDRDGAILVLCLSMMAFYAAKAFIMAWITWHQNNYVLRHQAAFAQRMLRSYLERPYEMLLGRNSTELIRNCTMLTMRLFVKGVLPLLQLTTEGLTLLGLVVILILVDPLVTIFVGLTMAAFLLGFYRYLAYRMQVWGEISVVTEGGMLLWLNQSLGALKVTKLAGLEDFLCSRFAVPVEERARVTSCSLSAHGWPRLALEALAVIALLAVLIFMLLVQRRQPGEVMNVLGILAVSATRLIPSGNKIVGAFNMLRENMSGVDILYKDMILEAGKGAKRPGFVSPLPLERELCLEGVGYSYPCAELPTLNDINLRVQAGASLALVGRSGAGKSTLADVVLGLLEPSAGRVLVDGIDIASNLRGWQSQIGYIPQDIYLLDDSLAHNIALGYEDDEIDFDHLKVVIEMSRLGELVSSLPNGIHTVVGERGSRLSGGQRQRVGIARALYRRPTVLVLDEATSALDSETEHDISDSIKALAGEKTVILIAHRLSTIRHCQTIALMEDGRIVDCGPYEQLAVGNETFARMILLSQLPIS